MESESLAALFPRFADAEKTYGSLIRAFRRRGATPSAEGAFKSLPGGLIEMVQALVNTLPAGSVHTSAGVTHIGRDARGQAFRVATAAGLAHECRALVLSTPAYVTAALVRDQDAEIARLCADIPYSSVATVALAFRRKDVAHPLNGSGYVVPRTESSGILAATWLSSKSAINFSNPRSAFSGSYTRPPGIIQPCLASYTSLSYSPPRERSAHSSFSIASVDIP